jgi:hypothetical protein
MQCDVLVIVSPPAVVQCLRDAEEVTVITVCLSRKELFRRWFELSIVSGEKRMPARMVALYGDDRDDARCCVPYTLLGLIMLRVFRLVCIAD